MSIIEETLNRLGTKENPHNSNPGNAADPVKGAAVSDNHIKDELEKLDNTLNVSPWSGLAAAQAKTSLLSLPAKIAIAALVLGGGVLVFTQFIDSGAENSPLLASMQKPKTTNEPAKAADSTPVQTPLQAKDMLAQTTAAVSSTTPTPITATPAAPNVATAPAVAPLAAKPAAPAETAKAAPAAGVAAATQDTKVRTVDTASKTGAVGALPSWVDEGHRLLAAKDVDGALKAWENGFKNLMPNQRIIGIAAFYNQNSAILTLKKLNGFNDAVVVKGSYAGKKAWRVLLVGQTTERNADIERAVGIIGIPGAAVTVVKKVSLIAPLPEPVEGKTALASAQPRQEAANRETAPAGKSKKAVASTETATVNVYYETQIENIAQAYRRGSYREAEELARTLLAQDGSKDKSWFWVGKIALVRGHVDDAQRNLARATELNPNFAEAWTLRGISAQEQNNHTQALIYFAEALKFDPNLADTFFSIGYSHDALGQKLEAESAWRRFLDLAGEKSRYAKQRLYVEQHLGQAKK